MKGYQCGYSTDFPRSFGEGVDALYVLDEQAATGQWASACTTTGRVRRGWPAGVR